MTTANEPNMHESGEGLLSHFTCKDLALRNRVMISPMAQYCATDGYANDYHLVHLGKYAIGGAGLIMLEATAVEARGRTTPFDLGLWRDEHVESLRRITEFNRSQGAATGVQLAHAGRKGNQPYPWDGPGPAITPDVNGYPIAPSAIPFTPECSIPQEMGKKEIKETLAAWKAAARRAVQAGFDVIEIHGAHGYLLHQFMSSKSNLRVDEYGGGFDNRIRYLLEVADAVRTEWPEDKPLFYRTSVVDPSDEQWTIDESVRLASRLAEHGVDLIDCSYGGLAKRATTNMGTRNQGFLVPCSGTIRRGANIRTAAVGLILDPDFADGVIRKGDADLIATGREALYNPHWVLHAYQELGKGGFSDWPDQYGWWLQSRAKHPVIR